MGDLQNMILRLEWPFWVLRDRFASRKTILCLERRIYLSRDYVMLLQLFLYYVLLWESNIKGSSMYGFTVFKHYIFVTTGVLGLLPALERHAIKHLSFRRMMESPTCKASSLTCCVRNFDYKSRTFRWWNNNYFVKKLSATIRNKLL